MSVIQVVGFDPVAQNYPVIKLEDVQITGANVRKVGNIWWVKELEPFLIRARMNNVVQVPGEPPLVIPFPDTEMSCPVMKMLNEQPIGNPRGEARIYNVPGATPSNPSIVMMELPLKLPAGNYLLSPEYLNPSLAKINAQFRLSFEPVDIDSIMVV
jgi:hypothetical protein